MNTTPDTREQECAAFEVWWSTPPSDDEKAMMSARGLVTSKRHAFVAWLARAAQPTPAPLDQRVVEAAIMSEWISNPDNDEDRAYNTALLHARDAVRFFAAAPIEQEET